MKKALLLLLFTFGLSLNSIAQSSQSIMLEKKPISKRDSLHLVRMKKRAIYKIENFNESVQNAKDNKGFIIGVIIAIFIGDSLLNKHKK